MLTGAAIAGAAVLASCHRSPDAPTPIPPAALERLARAYAEASATRVRRQEEVATALRRVEDARAAAAEQRVADASAQRQERLDQIRARQRELTGELLDLTRRRTAMAADPQQAGSEAARQIDARVAEIRAALDGAAAEVRELSANPPARPAEAMPAPAVQQGNWLVVRVVDGRSVVAVRREGDWTGEPERVRLLGVDAPAADEAGSERAKAALSALALNRTVWLEFEGDSPPMRDADGRLLAWAWTVGPGAEGKLVNAELLATGAARRREDPLSRRYAGVLDAAAACAGPERAPK